MSKRHGVDNLYKLCCHVVQLARVRLHALVVFSLLVLALTDRMSDSQAGWVNYPSQAVFDARTKRTAHKRYQKVLALREKYVQETPAAVVIFEFLERH